MSNVAVVQFVARNLPRETIAAGESRILEVGSWDSHCGSGESIRHAIAGYRSMVSLCGSPFEYIGVDIMKGPGVDLICAGEDLVKRFGEGAFDVVIATELLEHVKDWRSVVSNIKNVCRAGGLILVTTRSRGYHYHGYPQDFWRFELSDMAEVFCDCTVVSLESDPQSPGVFVAAQKPPSFSEYDLSDICLYSMITRGRVRGIDAIGTRSITSIMSFIIAKVLEFHSWLLSNRHKDIHAILRRQLKELGNIARRTR